MGLPYGAANIYTRKQLEGNLVANITNPVSSAGFKSALAGDAERTQWLVVNLSANDMYLGFGQDVSSTNGILLSGNGGFVSMHLTEDFEFVTLPVYVWAAAANNQLYVLSMRRQTAVKEG